MPLKTAYCNCGRYEKLACFLTECVAIRFSLFDWLSADDTCNRESTATEPGASQWSSETLATCHTYLQNATKHLASQSSYHKCTPSPYHRVKDRLETSRAILLALSARAEELEAGEGLYTVRDYTHLLKDIREAFPGIADEPSSVLFPEGQENLGNLEPETAVTNRSLRTSPSTPAESMVSISDENPATQAATVESDGESLPDLVRHSPLLARKSRMININTSRGTNISELNDAADPSFEGQGSPIRHASSEELHPSISYTSSKGVLLSSTKTKEVTAYKSLTQHVALRLSQSAEVLEQLFRFFAFSEVLCSFFVGCENDAAVVQKFWGAASKRLDDIQKRVIEQVSTSNSPLEAANNRSSRTRHLSMRSHHI